MLIENNKADYITLNKIKKFLHINIITNQNFDVMSDKKEEGKSKVKVFCATVHKAKGLEYDTVILPFTTTDITYDSGVATFIEDKSSGNSIIEYELRDKNKYNKPFYTSADFHRLQRKNKDDEIAEELRILYVAATRAERKLYYLYDQNKLNRNAEKQDKKYWAEYLKRG
jgi:DNA helicase II / ATP-dependent DNA helicase PcrA